MYLPVELLLENTVTGNTEIAMAKHQTAVLFIVLSPVFECRI